MTLFDLIYEFFEIHIFNDTYSALLDEVYTPFFFEDGGSNAIYISVRAWLCQTASIISIIIILVMCCLFIYKIIRLIGGLIR